MFQEKLYLHTDRTSYLTGETMWFKTYRVDASGHSLIDWSKILYVEILDKNQTPVLQAKFPLDRNGSDGSLFLPASLTSGNYVLRAYTNWMKNSGADFFFNQAITILNPFVPLDGVQDSVQTKLTYDAQFFPEGGDLVYGLESVVGVRVVDTRGHGVVCKGAVLNEQNDTVSRFSTSKFGLTKFLFTPQKSSTYHVNLVDRDKKLHQYSLPSPRAEGYVMHVADTEDNKIRVIVTGTNNNKQTLYVLGHTRQKLKLQQKVVMQNGRAAFEFDESLLEAGVSVITVFDDNLKARCERLYFKAPSESERVSVHVSGNPYLTKARQPVTLDFSFLENIDTIRNGVFSMSVYKLDSLDLPAENISEYLCLTSDLSGSVEQPAYYFSRDASRDDIENLMLTHGWRRFDWDKIQKKNVQSQFMPEIGGHLITAQITEKESGKAADRVPVYITFMGNPVNTYVSQSQEGRILFETEPITGNRSLIAQSDPNSKGVFRIELDDPFFDKASFVAPRFNLTSQQIQALEQRSIHMQVQNLFYGNADVREATYPYKAFYGKPDETYQLDDYTRFPTLEEVMREYVPGIRVKKRKDDFHLSIIDQVNKASFSDDPLVLVDGVPVFDINKLMEIDPLKLKQLDVIKKRWYLNAMAYDGIVSFTSYKGDLAAYQPSEQALLVNYKGLEATREFFSPQYSIDKSGTETLPDARRVLFWSTGALNPQHKVKFFTSDIAGEYRIVIQALSGKGLPGHYSTTFIVK